MCAARRWRRTSRRRSSAGTCVPRDPAEATRAAHCAHGRMHRSGRRDPTSASRPRRTLSAGTALEPVSRTSHLGSEVDSRVTAAEARHALWLPRARSAHSALAHQPRPLSPVRLVARLSASSIASVVRMLPAPSQASTLSSDDARSMPSLKPHARDHRRSPPRHPPHSPKTPKPAALAALGLSALRGPWSTVRQIARRSLAHRQGDP